ncbi:MAG: protein kinase [Polyangiales bacterium]
MVDIPPDEGLGRIGTYRVVAFLGKGGVGAVYRAVDDFSKRQVALKVILPEHRENAEIRLRFTQEARIGAQLRHPHIVQVLGGGEIRRSRAATEDTEPAVAIPRLDGQELLDGTLYVVFELLEGPSLRDHIAAFGPIPYWEVPSCLAPLFDAVAYMHGKGFVHRDLKPGNVHFGDDLKVLDLGSAKAGDEALARFEGLERTTGTNVPMTWEYRSPETFAEVPENDPQVDLWALAATVYRAVTGRLPFGGASDPASLVRRIVTAQFTPAREVDPSLPPAVDAFFARAFAPDKSDRFPSAQAMFDAARSAFVAPAAPVEDVRHAAPVAAAPETSVTLPPVVVSAPEGRSRQRWGVALVGVLAVAALVVAVLFATRSREPHGAVVARPTTSTAALAAPAPPPQPAYAAPAASADPEPSPPPTPTRSEPRAGPQLRGSPPASARGRRPSDPSRTPAAASPPSATVAPVEPAPARRPQAQSIDQPY